MQTFTDNEFAIRKCAAHKDSIDFLVDHFEFAPAKSMRFRAETVPRRDGLSDVARPQPA